MTRATARRRRRQHLHLRAHAQPPSTTSPATGSCSSTTTCSWRPGVEASLHALPFQRVKGKLPTVNAILLGAGVFAVLVSVVGTGLKAGVFELGGDSTTADQLKRPGIRAGLFIVGVAFLVLAVVTREQTPTESSRASVPAISIPKDLFANSQEEVKLKLSKHSGPPGTRLRVSGSGFQPGETIRILFHTDKLRDVQANSDGVFRDVSVRIPPGWGFDGPFDITAEGQASVKAADDQFTVTK